MWLHGQDWNPQDRAAYVDGLGNLHHTSNQKMAKAGGEVRKPRGGRAGTPLMAAEALWGDRRAATVRGGR